MTTARLGQLAAGSAGLALAWAAAVVSRPVAVAGAAAELTAPALAPASAPLPELRAAPDHVVDYDLDVRLDGVELHGSGEILLRNVSSRALDEIWLHLYLNAFEGPHTVYGRTPPTGFRGAQVDAPGSVSIEQLSVPAWGAELAPDPPHTPGEPLDRTSLRYPLPRSLPPGDSLRMQLRFTSKLPPVSMRTGHHRDFVFAGQWFPKLAKLEPDGSFAHFPFERFSEFYADYGRYDVRIDVPEAMVVGATGKLVESRADGGRRVDRYVQDGVHDFAFTAWPHFQVVEREHRGVAMRALFPPGHGRNAARALEVAAFGLDHYGDRYGPYPYATLSIVHPPQGAEEAGGMEYPTLITTGGPFWASASPLHAYDALVLHELGHQWFYGLLASDEHAWPFLDEGLTTFATGRALEARHPGAPLLAGAGLAPGAWDRSSGKRARHRATVAGSAGSFATGSDYDSAVYARAATLLLSIDGAFDGAATRGIEAYARRHRFAHPKPDDLLDAVGEAGGAQAREQLRIGLFERGYVDYEVVVAQSRVVDEGHEAEVLLRRSGTLRLPVELELELASGERVREVWSGEGDSVRIAKRVSAPLVRAVVDPDRRLPVDDDRFNDARSVRPSGFGWRSFASASLLARLVGELVAP